MPTRRIDTGIAKHRAREAGDRLDHIGKENNKKQTKLIQGEIPPFWLQRQF